MGLSFENMAAFLARATEAMGVVEEEGRVVLEEVANRVADDMRSLAPVGSGVEDVPGELAASISVASEGLDVLIHVDAKYSAHVEYGTSKMAPRPFARPALAQAKL